MEVSNVENRAKDKSLMKTNISVNSMPSTSTNKEKKKCRFNLADFGRDFTYETLAYLSPQSNEIGMCICESETLIYAEERSTLVILSLHHPKEKKRVSLNDNDRIRDLSYVDWLRKCLIITDEEIYLLDYRSRDLVSIQTGTNYRCGTIDNLHRIFYLVQQSTLYKYNSSSLISGHADEYPIADGYQTRHMSLDHRTNDQLALLVRAEDQKNYVLVYSTSSLSEGYLYRIVIRDSIDRHWICSNGDHGWLIQGDQPGVCWHLTRQGLNSIRMFDRYDIRNVIPMSHHQRFLIRTETEIFVLMNLPFSESLL